MVREILVRIHLIVQLHAFVNHFLFSCAALNCRGLSELSEWIAFKTLKPVKSGSTTTLCSRFDYLLWELPDPDSKAVSHVGAWICG